MQEGRKNKTARSEPSNQTDADDLSSLIIEKSTQISNFRWETVKMRGLDQWPLVCSFQTVLLPRCSPLLFFFVQFLSSLHFFSPSFRPSSVPVFFVLLTLKVTLTFASFSHPSFLEFSTSPSFLLLLPSPTSSFFFLSPPGLSCVFALFYLLLSFLPPFFLFCSSAFFLSSV